MVRVVERGAYRLVETKRQVKILALDNHPAYAWIKAENIGEILVTSRKTHVTDHILSIGSYALYEVVDEPHLTDLLHLELEVGKDTWQGYLLPLGLPTQTKKRHRIIPTTELVGSGL